MKTFLATMIITMALTTAAFPQNINWRSLSEDQHNLLQFNYGYDCGVTAQAGYYRTFTLFRPAAAGLDISVQMGNNLFDDYKIRLGVQIELLEIDGFSATARLTSAFRRYESPPAPGPCGLTSWCNLCWTGIVSSATRPAARTLWPPGSISPRAALT